MTNIICTKFDTNRVINHIDSTRQRRGSNKATQRQQDLKTCQQQILPVPNFSLMNGVVADQTVNPGGTKSNFTQFLCKICAEKGENSTRNFFGQFTAAKQRFCFSIATYQYNKITYYYSYQYKYTKQTILVVIYNQSD